MKTRMEIEADRVAEGVVSQALRTLERLDRSMEAKGVFGTTMSRQDIKDTVDRALLTIPDEDFCNLVRHKASLLLEEQL